jgi:hypothetical protein
MGIAEIARVLRSGGHLVLADPFAIGWLRPLAPLLRKRDRLWSGAQVDASLAGVGLETLSWETVYRVGPVPIIHAATARRL